MSERHTSNLATILAEALAHPPQERAAFLDRACAGDAGMRRDLGDLLAAHARAGDFLQRPAVPTGALPAVAAATIPFPAHEDVGSRIGAYKLLQLIGEGGFGSVYMAQQDQPVRRRVALKIIKLGMDTRQVIARFEAERQALAMMDHPNIARVLDAGATEIGRPYFVMELVHGVPITEYCDKAHLSPRSRLELFIRVCRAVQHAHQKGVIHRDIKPTNVLVTLHDGTPVPKVIDFGIAKAVSAKLTERTLFTEYRQFIGTPEYMSPEQAEMSGLDIDTRSDIYSLGVLLYELLTGVTPFDPRTLRGAAIGEIQRIIREQEPERPSTRVSRLTDTIGNIAARRGTEPAKLTRALRGDLDWIVMKALEKDRTRRYDTANSLALDVQRYLANEPVAAGPPGTTYRVRKFVRRNRGPVIAAVLLLAALLAGIAGTTIGLVRAVRAEHEQAELVKLATEQLDALSEKVRGQAIAPLNADAQGEPLAFRMPQVGTSSREQITGLGSFAKAAVDGLIASRQQAEIEREKSSRIAEFMEQTLQGAGPSVAIGRDTTMLREMMDAAARRIADGELRDAPEAEIRLRHAIGDVYRQLAAFDDAERMLRPAIDLARSRHEGDHDDIAQGLNLLSLTLGDERRLDEAVKASREALDMAQRLHPGDSEMVACGLLSHGSLLHDLGQLQESERLSRDGIAMYQRLRLGDHEFVAAALRNIAAIYRENGELEKAEPLYQEALDINRRRFVGDHPALSSTLQSLGLLHYDQGQLDKAHGEFLAALEMNQRLYPHGHIDIASNLDALAGIARARGEKSEAMDMLERAMGIRRRLLSPDSLDMAASMKNLAVMKYESSDLDGAETLMRESLAISRRLLPMDHPATQETLLSLAIVLQSRGDVQGSIDVRRELLESQRRTNPGNNVVVSRTIAALGLSLLQAGRPADAEQVLRECLTMRKALAEVKDLRPPQPPWHVANTSSVLGEALIAQAQDETLTVESRRAKLREAESLVTEGFATLDADQTVPRGNDPRTPGGGDNRVREALDRVIRLYETWDKLEPGQGYADMARQWRERTMQHH